MGVKDNLWEVGNLLNKIRATVKKYGATVVDLSQTAGIKICPNGVILRFSVQGCLSDEAINEIKKVSEADDITVDINEVINEGTIELFYEMM